MIRPGFPDPETRQDLIELARDGSAAHRLAHRANALVLLNDGMSYTAIAKVLPSAFGTPSIRKTESKAWSASAMRAVHAA